MYIKYFSVIILVILLSLIIRSYILDVKEMKDHVIFNFPTDNTINLTFYQKENHIPKVIRRNYGFKDNKANLKNYEFVFNKTKEICPDIEEELLLGRDEMKNFVLKYYNQEVLDIINLLNYNYAACISDIVRLLVIYAKGGIYLDIKSHIRGDITPELEKYGDKLICSYFSSAPFIHRSWTEFPPYGEISNWFFAAPKGHPVVRELIIQSLTNVKKAYLKKEELKSGAPYILSLAGPFMMTHVIKKSKNLNQVKFLTSFGKKGVFFGGWNGKLRKETAGVLHRQKGDHWTELQEPLFKI